MTAKTQELYQAVWEIIYTNVPQFRPLASMSDWETAVRNAFKVVLPEAKVMAAGFITPSEFGLNLKNLDSYKGSEIIQVLQFI